MKKLLTFIWLLTGFTTVLNAQDIVVTGRVTGAQNDALPGVNILVEGSTTGTTTDTDGKYSLKVPSENAALIFSYIGYATQRISVNGRSSIDVILEADNRSLDE